MVSPTKNCSIPKKIKVDTIDVDAIKSQMSVAKVAAKSMLNLVENKSQRMMTSIETTSKEDHLVDYK